MSFTNADPEIEKIEPIALVIDNNQHGWKNIIVTSANVTLDVGTKLFTEEQLTQAKEAGYREREKKGFLEGQAGARAHYYDRVREEERQRIIGILEGMKKTDTFPQHIIHFDHSVEYFERLSDGDIHYNEALNEAITKIK